MLEVNVNIVELYRYFEKLSYNSSRQFGTYCSASYTFVSLNHITFFQSAVSNIYESDHLKTYNYIPKLEFYKKKIRVR